MTRTQSDTMSIESVYGLILDGNWWQALEFIHHPPSGADMDPRYEHLARTLIEEYFRRLPPFQPSRPKGSESAGPNNRVHEDGLADPRGFASRLQAEAAERFVLFHQAGRIRLSDEQRTSLIVRLIDRYRDQPERALDFARFLPEEPVCNELLERYGQPSKRIIPNASNTGLHVTEQSRSFTSNVSAPLFKSMQEARFFEAIRKTFPTLVAVPNMAMPSVLSAELILPALTSRERAFFFRAVIDCVLFDPSGEYRTVACFELDSPLHDDDKQMARDDMKDRILALAGLRLVRIRPDRVGIETEEFQKMLSSIPLISDT